MSKKTIRARHTAHQAHGSVPATSKGKYHADITSRLGEDHALSMACKRPATMIELKRDQLPPAMLWALAIIFTLEGNNFNLVPAFGTVPGHSRLWEDVEQVAKIAVIGCIADERRDTENFLDRAQQ